MKSQPSALLRPLGLQEQLGKCRPSVRGDSPVRILHLVSNTLKIGPRLQEAFDALPEGFNMHVQTYVAKKQQTSDEFLRTVPIESASFVLLQVHGIENEERLLEPTLKVLSKSIKVIVYIHRPEELILRIALENGSDYHTAKGRVADLLRGCHAIVLSGQCFIPEYQEILPDVLVMAIPLGFAPPEGNPVDLQERLEPGAVTFVGSATTWGEMRHLEDIPNLIAAITTRDPGAKVTGYVAGKCDEHCNPRDFAERNNVVLLGNDEMQDAHANKGFTDETEFRNWLHEKARAKCLFRARRDAGGGIVSEDPSELPEELRHWERRLVDLNVQLYYEVLDEFREATRKGLPKVEYSGTLHKGGAHELFVVFESPAMQDVQRDEGFQMIQIPMARGTPDFAEAAERILRVIRAPETRRTMLAQNQESVSKIGMNEIAFAFYLLVRHLP